MKKYSKISSLLHILVLYCFVVSLYSNNVSASHNALNENHTSSNQGSFSMIPADLFCQSTQTETFVRGLSNHPVTSLKNQLNVFLACTKAAELAHISGYSKYLYYAKNKISWFRPVDIIFPFHYFW